MNLLAAKNIARRAVTLVEVIFSIGVILIGLLGLLSILPLAGRRAQDSIALSIAPSVASNAQATLFAEKFLNEGRLKAISAAGVPAKPWLNPSLVYEVTNKGGSSETVGTPLTESRYQGWRSVLPATDTFDVTRIRVPSFCIDPMLASLSKTSDNASTPNGYFIGCYPFYKQLHDPNYDPCKPHIAATYRQPRMQRVGVTAKSFTTFLEDSVALLLAENPDDLSITRAKDKSLPATLNASSGLVKRFERIDDPSDITDPRNKLSGRFATGEFSWIATVNPLPDGVYASVSLVILRNRVRSFDASPDVDFASSPSGNSQSERIGLVSYKEGFEGGAGGVIDIQSNINTVSTLGSGDWVMLSRYIKDGDSLVDYHRWYRVLHADSEAEDLGSQWKRRVTLDGPDWYFGYGDDGYATSTPITHNPAFKPYIIPTHVAVDTGVPVYEPVDFDTRTFATLIEGVVSVTERTMRLSDL